MLSPSQKLSPMPPVQTLLPPLTLPDPLPETFPAPKFHIGQQVYWSLVSTQDHGRIVGCVFAQETNVQAIGYHYVVQLDADSPSQSFGIQVDWGFESDLAPWSDRPLAEATAQLDSLPSSR